MLTGNGPSKRHEVWYFAQTKLGALRYDNYKYTFTVQPLSLSFLTIPRSYPLNVAWS
jgi:hypothetical protein